MQKIYHLSFGKIIKLKKNLAEVIVSPDVEFDMEMIAEYHSWLLKNLEAPFNILINKINSYTYTFEAQMNIANLPEIQSMAVVAYSQQTEKTTNVLINLPRKQKWNIRVFNDRSEALRWLETEQDQ